MEKLAISLETVFEAYSKFDSRPCSKRDLSKSFTCELLEKAGKKEFGEVEVHIGKKPKKSELDVLESRLITHFAEGALRSKQEQWAKRLYGTAYIILGGALLIAQGRVLEGGHELVGALLLPAGYFALFLGLEYVLSDWKLNPNARAWGRLKDAELTLVKCQK
jgi:hypothetical protein